MKMQIQLPYKHEDINSILRTYFNKMVVWCIPLNPVLGKQRQEDPENSLSVVYLNQWAPGSMTDYDGMECTWETRHLTHTLFIHVLPPFSRHLAIYSAECLIPESESQQICSTAGVTGAESGFWSYLVYIHEHISAKEASVQQSFKVSTLWIKQTHLHENNGWLINQPFSNAIAF